MKRIRKPALGALILLLTLLAVLWIIVARPIAVSQVADEPEIVVDPGALSRHVISLSEAFVPRNSANLENLNRTANYIKQELEKSSSEVTFQGYDVKGRKYKNVIANYGPDSEEIIVVGAHYDAYSEFRGADDNASGVAGLLELGRLLGSNPLQNRVVLVTYTLEEPPHYATANMGSVIHAKSLDGIKVKLMISLEMIGYFSDAEDSQHYPIPVMSLYYPNKGNFIAVVDSLWSNQAVGVKAAINKYSDLPAYSINAPSSLTGVDFSDHRSYWALGYPAVMVTDTAFYRNHEYHTSRDTHDRLNYQKMAIVVYGVFKYLQEIDT